MFFSTLTPPSLSLSSSPSQMLQLMGYRDKIHDLSDAEQVHMDVCTPYMIHCVVQCILLAATEFVTKSGSILSCVEFVTKSGSSSVVWREMGVYVHIEM